MLGGVPKSLPAMIKAYRMQDKAAQVGFDWDHKSQVYDKLQEELRELQEEEQAIEVDREKIADELGDVFFAMINYARWLGIDPETALERTNRKFKSRFEYIEDQAIKPLSEMSLDEMEALWVAAKLKERS